MFGDNGQTWLIKPEFVTGYLQCLLADIATNIDILHCETYCEINIREQEIYGSVFRRIMENHPKLSRDFLLCIHVKPLMKRLGSKD